MSRAGFSGLHLNTSQEAMTPLWDRIGARGPLNRSVAEKVVRATLSVLGAHLTDDEALAFAKALPGDLGRVLEETAYRADERFNAAELYDAVGLRLAITPTMAHEQVTIALHALGETIDPETRLRLVKVLPPDVATHFGSEHFGAPPPHGVAHHGPTVSTLATGRPGSRHPLSESAPSSGHTHSVAVNDDPHGETKLSSSRGLTQERHHEDLATGRPPSTTRPVSEVHDD